MKQQLCVLALFLCCLPAEGAVNMFFPIVTRARGVSTTFYTAIDVTNNHSSASTDVLFQYRSADGAINTSGTLTTLGTHGNFHTDDFIQLLADRGAITPTQANSTFGTLVLTFANAAFSTGTEASAVARIYNYLVGNSGASVALAYRAQPIRPNGAHRLTSIISDARFAGAGTAPVVLTNFGIANMGVDDSGSPTTNAATVTLSFFDPRVGIRVGTQPTYTLNPGQVVQINDVFGQFSLPSVGSNSLIVTVDGPTGATAPQIEGYVVIKDTSSNDGAYFSMQAVPPAPTGTSSTWYLSPVLDFTLNSTPTAKSTGGVQLCLSSMSWTRTLQSALTGTNYTFNLGMQSSLNSADPPNGRLLAEIIRRRSGTDTVVASKTFDTTKTYLVQNAVVTGPDFAGQSGDVLVFRARIQQGVPCIAEYTGAGTDSYIVISP
jgi:hypothetical protein